MKGAGSASHVDYILVGAVALLLAIGAQMVYSASVVIAHNEFGDETYFFTRQLTWIAIGTVGLIAAASIDYRRWQKVSLIGLILTLVALVLVLVPALGTVQYGSARWLRLGPLPSFQPSEIAKIVICIYMADWLARKGKNVSKFTTGSIPFLIILGVIAGLVIVEPDMGTAVIICAVAFSVFFVAGANMWHVILGFLPGGLLVGAVVIIFEPYRLDRFLGFIDPFGDPLGKGWQAVQTFYALGSGGWFGVGFGMSRQKAYYLPNAHTDSILAIIGEELGLVGTLAVVILLMVIGWRGLRIALNAPDPFGRLLAIGLTGKVVWQAIINIGAVTSSLPYTGVTLPFVSFGGNSLCMTMIGVGLLLSISRFAVASPVVNRISRPPADPPRIDKHPRPGPRGGSGGPIPLAGRA
ncbi:MAG: putative lipid II flippase FtsW [Chloroflexi bacterium]|nr:putative lipid II flippase FtsW [Chloroflexota bacterium]